MTVLDKLTYAASRESLAELPDGPGQLVVGDIADAGGRRAAGRRARRGGALRGRVAQRQLARRTPRPFIRTNLIGTFTLLEAVRKARHPLPPRLHRRGLRRPRARRPEAVHRGHAPTTRPAPTPPPRPAPTTWCGPGCAASACRRRSPTAPTTTARGSTSRSSSPARSPTSSTAAGPSSTAPASTCATGSTPTTTPRRCWTILNEGRIGETYLIGADGERNNLEVVQHDPAPLRPRRGRLRPRHRPRRPRPALRDRLHQAAHRARLEALASPTSRRAWRGTIEWYVAHEDWWRPAKDAAEASYAAKGQ